MNKNDRGKGYWKFNNSLLRDENYIKLVKQTIKDIKDTYKVRNNQQNEDNLHMKNDNQDEENAHTINDQLLLEMIILGIRSETIKYSSRKKKDKNKQEKQLEEDILKLEKKNCESSAYQEEINALDEKKK